MNYMSAIDADGFEYPTTLDALPVDETPKTPKLAAEPKRVRADVEQLCELLRDLITENGNRAPKSISDDWRKHARLLLDKDGVTFAQARAVIEWCQADDFWRPNILSMPKLRAKYPQLEAKAREAYRSQSRPSAPKQTTQQVQRDSLDDILAEVAGTAQPSLSAVPDLLVIEGELIA
jgi:hypothetical protein